MTTRKRFKYNFCGVILNSWLPPPAPTDATSGQGMSRAIVCVDDE